MSDVTRYYDRLDPRERMIAAIAAAARADDHEIDRLVRSCPRHTYGQTDPEYTRYMEAAEFVTTALAVELGPLLASLTVLDSVCNLLELRSKRYLEALWLASDAAFSQGVRWGWERSGRDDEPPDPNETADELPSFDTTGTQNITAGSLAALRNIAAEAATFSRGIWDGFEQWASSEGLEPPTLITVFADNLKHRLEAARPILDAADTNPKVAAQYADLCKTIWANYR